MSFTSCTLSFTGGTEKTVLATRSLVKTLGISGVKTITLKVGSKDVSVPIKLVKRPGMTLYLPIAIKQALRVPRSGRAYVHYDAANQELRLGPLIGIMTGAMVRTSAESPHGPRSSLMRSYLSAGANKAFYFAFTPHDVDWSEGTVVGHFVSGEGEWVRKTVPLPDVVYNRLASRRAEKQQSFESFKERFIRKGIPVFNWSYFDKWDVYKILEGDEMKKHVPESHINPSPETLKAMLERHKFIYLKPTAGSLGNGIYRLTYHPGKGYFARFRQNNQNVLLRYGKFAGLSSMLGISRGRLRNYVAQQGIRLIEIDSCPIDFRFHMHKNSRDEWIVAGIGAKKAGRGSVTTHVKNGGQVMTPEQALGRVFGDRGNQVLEHAKQVAIQLCQAIERNYKRVLGELGLDIGIDQNERIWMFEANSKPGRSIFKHPGLKHQGRASLNHLVDYSVYLAKFRPRKEA